MILEWSNLIYKIIYKIILSYLLDHMTYHVSYHVIMFQVYDYIIYFQHKACPAKKPRVPKPKNPLATSALPQIDDKRRNLTLADWMTVYTYIDSHPDANQGEIVNYFRTHPSGWLIFDQSVEIILLRVKRR